MSTVAVNVERSATQALKQIFTGTQSGPVRQATPKTLVDTFGSFFANLFKPLPKTPQILGQGTRGRLENVIDVPSSTRPIMTTGTKVTVATTGAAIAATTGFLTLTPGGRDLTKGFFDTVQPIAEGTGDIFRTFSQSPLLIGALIIIGGILVLKK